MSITMEYPLNILIVWFTSLELMATETKLEDVKCVDIETEMVVHGYIRQIETLFPVIIFLIQFLH